MDEDGSGLEPWEHQPNEDPRSYHVFEIFCQLGPERSVRAAAEKWYAETGHPLPKNPGARFADVARRWRWQERADWYWRQERRRAERLLQARRDAIYKRHAALSERVLEKMERGLHRVWVDERTKAFAEAQAKLLETQRFVYGDSDEERKHAGRPLEDTGSLPPIEDRLKPPEEAKETE